MGELLEGMVHVGKGLMGEGPLGPLGAVFERVINEQWPQKWIKSDEAIDLYTQGIYTENMLKKNCLFDGLDFQNFSEEMLNWFDKDENGVVKIREAITKLKIPYPVLYVAGSTFRFSPDEIIKLFRGKYITRDAAIAMLRRHGIFSPAIIEMILAQKDEFPTVQDLIQFSVRHGFEPDILSTFGYAKEIPRKFLEWADKIGLGGSSEVDITDATDSLGMDIEPHKATWAEQHWFAHWVLPSLGDAYEMLHRLYPDSKYGPSPDFSEGNEFTPELLSLFQRAQDIPKYWRNRLQSISYLPLSRVDVRRMYNLRIIDDAQVYHSYRAQGYNDSNSQALLQYAKVARQQSDIKNELWPKAEKICELYSLGVLDATQVQSYTEKLGIPREDVEDFLSNCDLETQLKRIKEALTTLKSGFLKGKINETQVRGSLAELEMGQAAIDQYLADWTMLQQNMEKEIAAKENQTWYEKGIIGKEEFITRLQNLQFNNVDVLHMVQLADMSIAETQAKLIQKEAKELAAKQKEQNKEKQQQIKEQEKEQKDYLKLLLSASTQTNLKAWWKKKLISEDLVDQRLTMLNYNADDIDRWKKAWG
jgi:hypothetical protein